MYDRRLDGQVLRLGHQGMLYHDSFVFYDHQTDSLWVHVTGEAFHGPLKGRKLRFLPSTVTTWSNWKALHPATTVLPGLRREGSYMGTYDGMVSTRHLGLVVVVSWKAKLYPLDTLADRLVINDTFNGEPLVLSYARDARSATAWSRRLAKGPGRDTGGRTLTFEAAKEKDRFGNRMLRDRETGSVWSWLTGQAVSGPLRGRLLRQLTYNPILNDRFRALYPGSPEFGKPRP